MKSDSTEKIKAPINWPAALVLTLTPLLALILIPWYSWNYDFSTAAWVSFFIIFPLNVNLFIFHNFLVSKRNYRS